MKKERDRMQLLIIRLGKRLSQKRKLIKLLSLKNASDNRPSLKKKQERRLLK